MTGDKALFSPGTKIEKTDTSKAVDAVVLAERVDRTKIAGRSTVAVDCGVVVSEVTDSMLASRGSDWVNGVTMRSATAVNARRLHKTRMRRGSVVIGSSEDATPYEDSGPSLEGVEVGHGALVGGSSVVANSEIGAYATLWDTECLSNRILDHVEIVGSDPSARFRDETRTTAVGSFTAENGDTVVSIHCFDSEGGSATIGVSMATGSLGKRTRRHVSVLVGRDPVETIETLRKKAKEEFGPCGDGWVPLFEAAMVWLKDRFGLEAASLDVFGWVAMGGE